MFQVCGAQTSTIAINCFFDKLETVYRSQCSEGGLIPGAKFTPAVVHDPGCRKTPISCALSQGVVDLVCLQRLARQSTLVQWLLL